MSKFIRLLRPLLMFAAFSTLFMTGGDSVRASSSGIVVSQVYGGGGNASATYQNDFIEIFNAGSSAVDVSTWSVQYAAATGTSWQKTNLSGVLQPGRYLLVAENSNAAVGLPLPTPDITANIPMAAGAGKVALVNNQTLIAGGTSCPTGATIVDFVGYGSTANCFEGAGPTGTISSTLAAIRAVHGCTDTDKNSADFATATPTPRNTATAANPCVADVPPTVSSTVPTSGATAATTASITINFSESVTATAGAFSLACGAPVTFTQSASPASSFTLSPTSELPANTACNVVVTANQITDTDGTPDNMASNYPFSFTTDAAPAVTGTTPSAGATNVSVNAGVTVNFSEAVTVSNFAIFCNGDAQAGSTTTSSNSFTFTPNPPFPHSAPCLLMVGKNEVSDADLNDPPDGLASDFALHFTTAAADTAPAVTTTNPANGATDVPVASNIVINFSEQVTATTNAFSIQCGSTSVAFGQTSGAHTSFTLDPNVDLPSNTNCTVTVSAAEIADTDGDDPPINPVSDYSFSFTTEEVVANNVIINELDADTPGDDKAEFVELFDGGVGNTSLNGMTLVFYDGGTDVVYKQFDLTGYQTNASGYFVVANPGVPNADLTFDPGQFGNLQNGADAVVLYKGHATSFPNGAPITTANILDAVVYGTDDPTDAELLPLINAGQPQVNESVGGDQQHQSSSRCDNGTGGKRNTDTYLPTVPTPGEDNVCPPLRPASTSVVISQFFGSGGNSGGKYLYDFVELYNLGSTTIDLAGWSLQYAAATGRGWDFNVTPLGGPIAAGEYYLVQLASSNTSAGQPVLPVTPNVTGPINMSGTSGKIALVQSVTPLLGDCPLRNPNLIDLVGYGSANCGEGGTKAPSLAATKSDLRINSGATDTNNNQADFTSIVAAPRRTAPIVELGPWVVSTDPANNFVDTPRDPTIVVQFSEPVTIPLDQPFYDLNCDVTGHHDEFTAVNNGAFLDVTPNVNLLAGESCTFTLFHQYVHDTDTDDSADNTDTLFSDYSWSFTVATGTPPPFPSSVHVTFGNPTNATANPANFDNYFMDKPEYNLSYNRTLGRPNWVSWHLSSEWYGTLTRVDTFRADPQVPPDWYRVQSFDFSGSGFDRGHMTPNADRDNQNSKPINQATYLMSNMVAQAPGNNQGPWAALEAYLRTLTDAGNEIYIVAGPEGAGGTGSNGGVTTLLAGGHVTVPAHTWKVALVLPKAAGDDVARVTCDTRIIAVIMPNIDSIRNDDWHDYLATIDDVEALTGYDLFSNLSTQMQACIEARKDGDPALSLDTTPPVVNCDPADGHWHGDNVTLSCTATDGSGNASSGLVNPGDVSFTLSTSVASGVENGNASTNSRDVCDKAGNCTTAGPIGGNRVDLAAPAIALTQPADGAFYHVSYAVNASFSCADSGAGLATCAGTVANGAAIDTSTLGVKSFTVNATDTVGNSSIVTVTYNVVAKLPASISINNIPGAAVNGGSFTPTVTYTGDGTTHVDSLTQSVCKVTGGVVKFVNAGTCTLQARGTPSGVYDWANGPLQSFTVAP